MIPANIGRRIVLRHTILSVITVLLLLPLFLILFEPGPGGSVGLYRPLVVYWERIFENLILAAITLILMLPTIWYFGGRCGEWVILKGMSPFSAGFWCLFTLWIFLFVYSVGVIALFGVLDFGFHSFTFFSGETVVYILSGFAGCGVLNGVLTGYFLGNEIKIAGKNASMAR